MRVPTLVLLALTALAAGSVEAEVQRIALEPAQQQVAVGGVATVTIAYDADDKTVAGLAARLHYDSSKLTLESAEVLFPDGLVGHQEQPDSGSGYDQFDDGDPSTDLRYVGAWTDLHANWPGQNVGLPLPLLRLQFRVQSGFESTRLLLTGDHCASCRFMTQHGTIVSDRGDLLAGPTATPDPSGATATAVATATPTTTVTPGPDQQDPPAPQLPEPGQTVTGIPTLSGMGTLLLIVALGGCAVGLLFKNRR